MATRRGARTLWLLRHAKTVTDPPPGGADFDRVLAPRGRRDAAALGRLFAGAGEGLGPGLKASRCRRWRWSRRPPAPRPQPSWSWPTWPIRRECRFDAGLYGAEPDEVLAFVRTLPDDVDLGHGRRPQPDGALPLAGPPVGPDKKGLSSAARTGFPTCALGVYSFASTTGPTSSGDRQAC